MIIICYFTKRKNNDLIFCFDRRQQFDKILSFFCVKIFFSSIYVRFSFCLNYFFVVARNWIVFTFLYTFSNYDREIYFSFSMFYSIWCNSLCFFFFAYHFFSFSFFSCSMDDDQQNIFILYWKFFVVVVVVVRHHIFNIHISFEDHLKMYI